MAEPRSTRMSYLDRPIIKGEETLRVSHSAYVFLFSEMCLHSRDVPQKVKDLGEWEERLATMGQRVGEKCLELAVAKDASIKQRNLTAQGMLDIIRGSMWTRWFGKSARLEAIIGENNYVIIDEDPYITRCICMPREYTDDEGHPTLNFASYVAGMVQGVLNATRFPAKVSAFSDPTKEHPNQTQFYVQFEKCVGERERRMRK